jgi:lipopolysaccharide biosynthesis regulator YciM
MAADVSKQLERAKKFLEKNRVEDAIQTYQSVLHDAPQHQEATQALGDLYSRLDLPDRAAVYYGYLFDLLIEPKDETKALAIFPVSSQLGVDPAARAGCALRLPAAKAESSR